MSQEFISLNKSNQNIFFNILSASNIAGLSNYSIDKNAFEKFILYQNIKEKTSFLLKDDSKEIGIFLSSILGSNAYIPAIAVQKNFQKKGYGKILLQKGILLLQESKAKTLTLEVADQNINAIALYNNEKFEITDEVINFRNETNSFYSNNSFYKNIFKVEKKDSFAFQILFKTFHGRSKLPFHKNLNYLLAKLEDKESELYVITKKNEAFGYIIIMRKINIIQIEDIAFNEYDADLFSYILTQLIKNEKIVQANSYYPNDEFCKLFLKKGFYIDLKQYEMKRIIK